MNSTTTLMLSRALEAERRRQVERRPRRFVEPELALRSTERPERTLRWFRFLKPAGRNA